MANVKEYTQIMHDLKSGKYHPLYLLHGEEAFYIDRISKYIEQNAIEEHERDFNLSIYYGRDVQSDELLESIKRFPMMAPRQVVILREAQDFQGNWDAFEAYFNAPIPSTVFVIDFKYKKVDERKKWVKQVKKTGVTFYSNKHYDSDLPGVITQLTNAMKYRINPSAALLMAEYLGNDLEKIEGELKKLMIKVPLSKEIEQNDVRENIGISKEYSAFDLVDALAMRDATRSYRIAHFIGKNEKNNPLVLTISSLYSHFSKLFMILNLNDRSQANVMRAVPGAGNPYYAKKLTSSAAHYSPRKCALIIQELRVADARLKGVDSAAINEGDLLKELIYFILN